MLPWILPQGNIWDAEDQGKLLRGAHSGADRKRPWLLCTSSPEPQLGKSGVCGIPVMTVWRMRHSAPGELQIKVAARGSRVSMTLVGTEEWPRKHVVSGGDSSSGGGGSGGRTGCLDWAVCLSFPSVLW